MLAIWASLDVEDFRSRSSNQNLLEPPKPVSINHSHASLEPRVFEPRAKGKILTLLEAARWLHLVFNSSRALSDFHGSDADGAGTIARLLVEETRGAKSPVLMLSLRATLRKK